MSEPQENSAHEALCRRCGRCCYEKFIVDGRVFTTRRPCRHLDASTHLCTVYEKRFEVNPRCLDVKRGIAFHVFPATCPYVRDLSDYIPSEEGWLDEAVARKIERGAIRSLDEVVKAMRRTKRRTDSPPD